MILQNALAGKANVTGFGSRVHQRFASLADKGLTIPDRTEQPRAAEFPGMIILDSNVLSELMRANPDENVLAWLDAQNMQDLQTTSITVAELFYGVARLPHGRRKSALRGAIESFDGELAGKVLPST